MTKKQTAGKTALEAAFVEAVDTMTEAQAEIMTNPKGEAIGSAPLDMTALLDTVAPQPMVSASDRTREEKETAAKDNILRVERAWSRADESAEAALEAAEGNIDAAISELMGSVIDRDNDAIKSSETLVNLLNRKFGFEWPTWVLKDVANAGPNLRPAMVEFFAVKERYYADYKAKYAGTSVRPNPSTSWGRLERNAVDAYNRALLREMDPEAAKAKAETDRKAKGARKTPEQAIKAALSPLYVKVRKAAAVEGLSEDRIAYYDDVGSLLHLTLRKVCTDTELQALAEKF